MERGWKATGLLKPLWGRVGGRDGLAARTGIVAANLSGYNTGRLRLGLANAERIAQALQVTIYDLGAPASVDSPGASTSVLDHLEEVRTVTADLLERSVKQDREIRRLRSRVAKLEAQREAGAVGPKAPRASSR
jgi:transcriptional regulator with XRE-family HTH domain